MLVISPVLVVAAAQPEKMLQRRVSDPQRERKCPPSPLPTKGGGGRRMSTRCRVRRPVQLYSVLPYFCARQNSKRAGPSPMYY